jgi:hypothetical protein
MKTNFRFALGAILQRKLRDDYLKSEAGGSRSCNFATIV